jgi:L,D-peptidoglycan transpeptidase YkuD (ErfK/YbiS/YcfS/YnhG family)
MLRGFFRPVRQRRLIPVGPILALAGLFAVGLGGSLNGSITPPRTRTAVHVAPLAATRPAVHHPASRIRQPFPGNAGDALQVVSVTAGALTSTTGRLQLWERAGLGSSWRPVGKPVPVHLGSAGMSPRPSEAFPATPLGSFTLTHAFGRDPNPAHRITLAYRQLQPGDGWSTAPGPTYNTLEHYSNEMYAGRDGWMRAAVLIDYNTAHPVPGAGSGFFVHVGDTAPTDGCVGLPVRAMLGLIGWLRPAAHPRLVTALA